MRKHENLTNEITGAYYKEQGTFKFYFKNTILILCFIVTLIALYDLFIGIDTEWLADLLVMFVNK